MSRETRVVPQGLVTEPSRILGGDGGLIRAQNVVCRRPGLMEPRGGLRFSTSVPAASAGFTVSRYARKWQGQTWFAAHDGTDTRVYRGNSAAHLIEIDGQNANVRAAQFRDRQAWAFDGAIRMLDYSQSATPMQRLLGAPRGTMPGVGTSTDPDNLWLPADYAVAYRVVFVVHADLTGGDGYNQAAIYGAPGDRSIVQNPAGSPSSIGPQLRIRILDLAEGDEVQVYRSSLKVTPYTASPDDEMRLRLSHILTAADIVAGYVDLHDYLDDGAWNGPALYTNASQDGLDGSNYMPRFCNDIAYYNGMAFFAGANAGYRKSITVKSLGDRQDLSQTLCSVYFKANISSGSPTISAVPSLVFRYLATGQVVQKWDEIPLPLPGTGVFPTGTYIVAFNAVANTITMSANATTTLVANDFVAWDWIGAIIYDDNGSIVSSPRIFAQWVDPLGIATFSYSDYLNYILLGGGVFATDPLFYSRNGGPDMAFAWEWKFRNTYSPANALLRLYSSEETTDSKTGINLTWDWDLTYDPDGNVDFRRGRFDLYSSKPNAHSIQVPSTPIPVDQSQYDGGPARLSWSKLLQPESVPLGNFNDIGDPSSPIVRLFASSDCLWIFKTDGLWRCYGTDPAGLTFQQVDPTLRMIKTDDVDCSGWASRIGDTIYVWAQGGISAVDSSGVRRIDSPIETYVRSFTPNPIANTDIINPFAAASLNDGFVLFGFESSAFQNDGLTLCYYPDSNTWSTWATRLPDTDGGPSGAIQRWRGSGVSDDGSLALGVWGGYATYADSPGLNSAALSPAPTIPIVTQSDTVDAPTVVMAPNILSSVVDIIECADAPPAGAMLIDAGGEFFLVVEQIDATHARLDHAGANVGQCIAIYFAIDSVATYSATTEGDPMLEKFYIESFTSFQSLRGGLWYDLAFRKRGDSSADAVSVRRRYALDLTSSQYQLYDRERQDRVAVPVDAGRQTGIEATVSLEQACRYFALSSFVLSYGEDSTLVGRGDDYE